MEMEMDVIPNVNGLIQEKMLTVNHEFYMIL